MKVQQTNNNINFGMNFKFMDSFKVAGSRLTPLQQREVIDTFAKLNKDPEIIKDKRTVNVLASGIKAIDNNLGNIFYEMRLTKDSISNAVKSALEDKNGVEAMPKYAKDLSEKMGINLHFSTINALEIADKNPAQNIKLSLDTIAQRMGKFPDKNDIKVAIGNADGNDYNAFKILMQKGDTQVTESLYPEAEPASLGERIERCHRLVNFKDGKYKEDMVQSMIRSNDVANDSQKAFITFEERLKDAFSK